MYGHVESEEQKARHIAYIRDIQKATQGFTEFVPLGFIHTEAPMHSHHLVDRVRSGPTGTETVKLHAISRLMLNNWIPNLQVSWVKEGIKFGQYMLATGVNDMGGTLMNESISTSAGAQHGQLARPSELRSVIRSAGRIPAERHTNYKVRHVFEDGDHHMDPLDLMEGDPETRFGSYHSLVKMDTFRFHHPKGARLEQPQTQ